MQDVVCQAMSKACGALQLETTIPADIKQKGASGRRETLPLAHNQMKYLIICPHILRKKGACCRMNGVTHCNKRRLNEESRRGVEVKCRTKDHGHCRQGALPSICPCTTCGTAAPQVTLCEGKVLLREEEKAERKEDKEKKKRFSQADAGLPHQASRHRPVPYVL